jgi:hypothetical protein
MRRRSSAQTDGSHCSGFQSPPKPRAGSRGIAYLSSPFIGVTLSLDPGPGIN